MEEKRKSYPGQMVPPGELRGFFRNIVCGLNYLHQAVKIAHRDIKPENIMLDAANNVRIIDFGTAEIFTVNQDGTACDFTARQAGTPAFYAPEMCNADIDEFEMVPTDSWALGVTLYQLVYGKLPFEPSVPGPAGLMQLMDAIEGSEVSYPAMQVSEIHRRVTPAL
jgi:[calcium/calmodulin-dependent protein kinase] kinase